MNRTCTYQFTLRDGVPQGRLNSRQWADDYSGTPKERADAMLEDLHRYGLALADVSIREVSGALLTIREIPDENAPRMIWEWLWETESGEFIARGYCATEADAHNDAYRMNAINASYNP